LLQAIIGQQVSVASAAAIWERIQAAGLCREAAMAQASTEDLARLGLSRPKIRYAKALALSGLDYEGLAALSDAEVLSRLTAITGIGRWTAEVYALQALGRADVFHMGTWPSKRRHGRCFICRNAPARLICAPWLKIGHRSEPLQRVCYGPITKITNRERG